MSSLWFQRTQTEASNSANSAQEHPSNVTSIFAAAGSELPLLASEHLSFDKTLGKGSSFVVNRELYSRFSDTEPYYVAVKHIIVADQPPNRLQQHYDKVARELRVLTHPDLKENHYILKILAYGWINSPKGRSPYLVVDYSNYGTLNEYLSQFETTWADRREFGLDVALGLKALHESKIVHGDVKPSNILVFEARGLLRGHMARISDFGGAIFDLDDNHANRYGGTSIYNAPEQEQRGKYKSETMFAPEQLYQADIYSFGITLWEIMKHGKSYIDDEWLSQGETRIEFLNRIHEEEENPLLRRAQAFCETVVWKSLVYDAFWDCVHMTLRDTASQRSDITQIVDILIHQNPTPRPRADPYPGKWNPPPRSSRSPVMSQIVESNQKPFTSYKVITHSANLAAIHLDDSSTEHYRLDVKAIDDISEDARKGIMTVFTRPKALKSSHSGSVDLDLFQAIWMPSSPWSVQCEVVRNWHAEAASTDSPKRYQASLQLAVCYHIGYGVRPDPDLMLRYLTASLEGSSTTMALYDRLTTAMTLGVEQSNRDVVYMSRLDWELRHYTVREIYFATRIRLHQQLRMKKICVGQIVNCKQHRTLTLAELVTRREFGLLSDALSSNKYNNTEISCALREASRCGNASMVQLICAYCDKFVHDENLPTPLHWLIMFEESEATVVVEALIYGSSAEQVGSCRANINSNSGTLFVSEHCLELFGTPLHWAVRTRNLKLVELLVKLGADINARTEIPTAFITGIHRPRLPSLSPLDIAVLYHLPEIVARLLELGANWEGGGGLFTVSHSAFLCIGLTCIPFSRYIIHGKHHRGALKETIRVLAGKGYSINDTNTDGDDPLKVALSNADCDSYIIEELLIAGALPSQRNLLIGENAVDVAISHAPYRRYSVENLRLVLRYVRSVDDFNLSAFNATHGAALGGSEAMVEVLSTAEGFDVDAITPTKENGRHGGQTALHLAAISGSAEVISLLVQKGANMEIPDAYRYTPLQLATFHRKTKAVDVLIELGANVFFPSGVRNPGDTILHVAVAGATSGYSLVKHLLTRHSRLQEYSLLNAGDHAGQTALHKAPYYGDYEAVEILLANGADRTLMDKPTGTTLGATPLQRVEYELIRHSSNLIKGRSHANNCHIANLHGIAQILKDDNSF